MNTRNRIIVVDDEHDVIDVLRENLEDENLDVHVANSGEEALSLIRIAPIDLVITDIKMPDMTGIQLAQKIREVPNCFPYLVFVTATPLSVKEMYDAGADAFSRKPIDFEALGAMIRHFLERAKLARSKRLVGLHADPIEKIHRYAQSLLTTPGAEEPAMGIIKIADELLKVSNKSSG